MFRQFILLLLIILMIGCGQESKDPSRIEKPTESIDEQHFLITANGDSLPTNVPIPVTGRRIRPDSVVKPRVTPVSGSPRVVSAARNNIYPVNESKAIPVPDNLKVITPGQDGVPLPDTVPAQGKVVPALHPPAIPASPMQMREGAITDLQYLDLGQGMNVPAIWDILEDRRGYLWLATNGGGLSRYDGASFTHYTTREGLSNDYVLCALEDHEGNLWFGTVGGGLNKYDGNTFTHYTTEGGLSNNIVWSILEDSQKNLWIGTEGNGVSRFDGETFIHFTPQHGLTADSPILEDGHGNLWFGGAELFRFDGISFTNYSQEVGLQHINAGVKDDEGNLWFVTAVGSLVRYDPDANEGQGSFTHYSREGLSARSNSGWSVLQDDQGDLWFGSDDGITRFDGQAFIHFGPGEGLNTPNVWSIMQDSQGNIWFGSSSGGLMKYGNRALTYITSQEDLRNLDYRSVLEDRNGNIWFGTQDKGVIRYDPEAPNTAGGQGTFTFFTTNEGLSSNRVMAMLVDHRGILWIGTRGGGVNRLDPDAFNGRGSIAHYSTEQGLSHNRVLHIMEDHRGHLWFGTWGGGLTRFEPDEMALEGHFTHFTTEQGLSNNVVWSALEDQHGNLWLAHGPYGGGISRLELKEDQVNGQITHYSTSEGLSHNSIWSIFEDDAGNLWFGTVNGLDHYHPTTGGVETSHFRQYATDKELGDNWVKEMQEDSQKNLWVNTMTGLTRLSRIPGQPSGGAPSDPMEYQFSVLGKVDGMKRSSYWSRDLCLDRQNKLWAITTEGIVRINPDELKLAESPPQIRLNTIDVAQNSIDYLRLSDPTYRDSLSLGSDLAGSFDSVTNFYNYPLSMTLPHRLNHLTFHFSAIDWAAPQKLKYQYLMEGLDESWSPLSSENKADYRNLPPGHYTFKVKAIGAALQWSDEFEYAFRILPPWWLSWWAYVLYAVVILLVLRGLYLYQRRRWLLQTQLQLEQEKAERLRDMDQFKSRFYTNITHEFRTPLTVIKGMAGQISGHEKIRSLISRNSDRLLNLINQMLDLSKLEANSLAVKWVQGDVITFLRYLTDSCYSMAESKAIHLTFSSREESLVMDYDESKLQQILINLLSNALKFTADGGRVDVAVAQVLESGHPFLELVVKDTGRGIAQEDLPHIFDRFYQAAPDDYRDFTRQGEGSGIGLSLVKELVQLLEGRVKVESELGKGSVFVVYLPVHKKSLAAPKMVLSSFSPDMISDPAKARQGASTSLSTKDEKPQILIIEDSNDIIEYILSCLQEDYSLQAAFDGKEGVEKALEIIPDVIICDVMMPEMDGFEVCRRLKSNRLTSHIPIILLTAKATQKDKISGLEQGADAYLTKPFDQKELKVRLHNLAVQSKRLRDRLLSLVDADDLTSELEKQEAAFLNELHQIILSNLDNELFNTDLLCKTMAVSRSQLYRKLKALTGQSPAECIRSIRLQKARSLLITTNLPIGEVALQVGFKDFSHFSRSFFKVFGDKPSDIRK